MTCVFISHVSSNMISVNLHNNNESIHLVSFYGDALLGLLLIFGQARRKVILQTNMVAYSVRTNKLEITNNIHIFNILFY